MDAEGSVNGGSSALFEETVASLRNHLAFHVRPHVDEVLESVAALVRAEQANFAHRIEPAGKAAKRASTLFAMTIALGVVAAIFSGCALVAVVLLTAPEEYQLPLLGGIAAVLIASAIGAGMSLMKAFHDVSTAVANVANHYKEPK